MHTLLRPSSEVNSEAPKASLYPRCEFQDVPLGGVVLSLCHPGTNLPPPGSPGVGLSLRPFGPHRNNRCAAPVREETRMQSHPGNASARPVALPFVKKKCTLP